MQCRREVDSNTPAHFPALPVSYAMGDVCASVHPSCVSIKVQGEWCWRASWEKYDNYCLLETITEAKLSWNSLCSPDWPLVDFDCQSSRFWNYRHETLCPAEKVQSIGWGQGYQYANSKTGRKGERRREGVKSE